MSDTRVIRTMLLLQELKTKSPQRFCQLQDATNDDYHDCICYDSEHPLNSTSFGDIGGQPYPIVWGALIDEIHHDVISYYDTVIDGKVYAIVDPRTAALSRSRIFFLTKNPLIWFSMATIGTKFEPKQQNRLSFREPVSFCLFFINKHRTAQNWGLQMSLIYFCVIQRIALMYPQDFVLLVVHIA